MNRRHFLETAGRDIAGTGLGLLVLPKWARGAAPSDQIVMGAIGTGGRGTGVMRWFTGQPDVRMAAVADVDDLHCTRSIQYLHGRYRNNQAKGYRDLRRLLDRNDIDAICSGTPDHWHALVAILSFQAGKDVYCEKPLAHNYREARAMQTTAHRYARVFQLGTQIHSGENYHRVVELVRSRTLGAIHTVRVWKAGGTGLMRWTPPPPVPKTLDYDLWLGPAPWRPYHPTHVHRSFRRFLDYSTGTYADFWCHISDIAYWALDLKWPSTIVTRGELQTQGMGDTPKWVELDLQFPGIKYYWTSRRPAGIPGTVGGSIGCCFEGTHGKLVTDYSRREIFLDGEVLRDLHHVPRTIPRSRGHHRNFLDAVRTRGLTESNLPYAVPMTAPMFFGRIALLLGRSTLRWDAEKEQFVGDDEATRLLGRVMREPWTLPV